MARKKVTRSLARLPAKATIGSDDHRTDRLLELLRNVAVRNQREQPQPFHSIREIAERFKVPHSSVAQVYRQLESEGLLTRVRGSKTVLQGLHYDRKLTVRAFLALPASLSSFVTIQDYRMFFIQLRRLLRLGGFATAMAFFDPQELETRAFGERLRAYDVDTVMWFRPPPRARNFILPVLDKGVRVLALTDGESTDLPVRYEFERADAIRNLLTQWQRDSGVSNVQMVLSPAHVSKANEDFAEAALMDLGIKIMTIAFRGPNTGTFLSALAKRPTDGVIFPSASLASRLSFRRPAAMTELLRKHRVAFLGGPVNMPFANVPDVRVDLVTFDWHSVAKQIVDDLTTQKTFRESRPTIFEADTHLRVPLNRFAQNI